MNTSFRCPTPEFVLPIAPAIASSASAKAPNPMRRSSFTKANAPASIAAMPRMIEGTGVRTRNGGRVITHATTLSTSPAMPTLLGEAVRAGTTATVPTLTCSPPRAWCGV